MRCTVCSLVLFRCHYEDFEWRIWAIDRFFTIQILWLSIDLWLWMNADVVKSGPNSGIISNKRPLPYCNIGLFSSIFWTRVQHKSLHWQALLRNGIMKEDPISNSSNFVLKIPIQNKNCIRCWTSVEITKKFSFCENSQRFFKLKSQDFGPFDTFGIIAQASIFENFSFLGRS